VRTRRGLPTLRQADGGEQRKPSDYCNAAKSEHGAGEGKRLWSRTTGIHPGKQRPGGKSKIEQRKREVKGEL
jgi:hypothetical protein